MRAECNKHLKEARGEGACRSGGNLASTHGEREGLEARQHAWQYRLKRRRTRRAELELRSDHIKCACEIASICGYACAVRERRHSLFDRLAQRGGLRDKLGGPRRMRCSGLAQKLRSRMQRHSRAPAGRSTLQDGQHVRHTHCRRRMGEECINQLHAAGQKSSAL